MVNSNESITPEATPVNPEAKKQYLTIPTDNLSKHISQEPECSLNRSGYRPSPRITPRTSHFSLPSSINIESKPIAIVHSDPLPFFAPQLKRAGAKRLCQSHLSLPIYLSTALPVSIQNWGDQSKMLLSSKSVLVQKSKKNLELVLDHMWGQSIASLDVLAFLDELIFINDYFPPVGLKIDLPKIITELTYLIYNKPKCVSSILNIHNVPESIDKINYHFTHALKRVHQLINESYNEQIEKGISSAKKAKHIAIPIAISRILILPVGTMLEALIPSIIEEFVNEDNPYSRSLKSGLKLIHQSDELKNAIEEIGLPQDPFSDSALLIRATLNLAEKTELNAAHAKRTALSALLTHIRQGQNGTCFASFIAIELQSINPLGALVDFKQLLKEGKLLRTINNQSHDFPYLMKAEPLQTSTEWKVSGAGKLHSDPLHYLWDHPGIQAVCHYLSIPAQEFILDFLNSHEKSIELTIHDILDDIVKKYACKRDHLEFIFSSSTQHPLLSIWGNSIAGMAEGLSGGMLKSALAQSVQYWVKKVAKANGCLDLLNKYEVLQKIENAVMQRAHYLYDPTITVKSIVKGAFVLYDSHNSKDFKKWTQAENSAEFLNFLKNILESILENNEINLLKNKIIEDLNDDDFIPSILKRYHRENKNIPLNSDNIKFLRYTPWVNSIGNDPQMVMKVYHETENTYRIEQIAPANAEQLLNSIAETLQKIPYDRKKKYLSNGNYILPLRIKGVHIFSLLVCHPSMQPYLLSGEKQKYPATLVKALSKFPVSFQFKSTIKDFCRSIVEKKHHKAMNEKLTFPKKKYSAQELREFLIRILKEYKPIPYREEDLIRDVDLKIVELLPQNIRTEWENSIVHFADTNWQSDIQDIHYGIGINPGTGKTELMSVLGNGKIYKFLDQNQFLNGKVWELYLDL